MINNIRLVFLFVLVIFFNTIATALNSETIVFSAQPKKRNNTELSINESAEYVVLIKKVADKYIWVTRNKTELSYSRSGIFHIFTAKNGSGFISISDATILGDSLKKDIPLIEYGEHIRFGIGVISYYGEAGFINP